MMTISEKTTFWSATRQLLYCAGCFVMIFLEYAIATIYKDRTFDENGIMENLQLGELLFACALFCIIALRQKTFTKLSLFFASLCAFAACREMDNLLDDRIPAVGWKIAFIFIAAAVIYALKHWKCTREELFKFLSHPSFIMMCFAVTTIIPIAQCVGHKSFVINVLQMEHVGSIKEFIEESIETIGYFILLCSAVELLCHPNKQTGQES